MWMQYPSALIAKRFRARVAAGVGKDRIDHRACQ